MLAAVTTFTIPKSSGVNRCYSISDPNNRDSCIESFALTTGNSSLCGKIQGYYGNNCYATIAFNTSNPELCHDINSTSLAALCLTQIAYSTMKPSICSQISTPSGSDSCFDGIAIYSGNESSCSLIENSSIRTNCSSSVNFNEALKYSNASFCGNVSTGGGLSSSYQLLSNLGLGNYGNLYFNITQFVNYEVYSNRSIGPRDLCYISLAYATGNSNYCSSVQNPEVGSDCSTLIGRNATVQTKAAFNYTDFLSYCGALGNSACNDSTRYLQALLSNNVSICNTLSTSDSYQCYFAFATKYNDTSYCGFIKNATANNDCVVAVEGGFSNSTP